MKSKYHIDVTPEEDMLFRDNYKKSVTQSSTFKKSLLIVVGIHSVIAVLVAGNLKPVESISGNKTIVKPSPTPQVSDAITVNSTVSTIDEPVKIKPAIPKASPKPDYQHPKKYVVRKGDTLTSISKKLRVSVNKLIIINKITDPNKLQPGQLIKSK